MWAVLTLPGRSNLSVCSVPLFPLPLTTVNPASRVGARRGKPRQTQGQTAQASRQAESANGTTAAHHRHKAGVDRGQASGVTPQALCYGRCFQPRILGVCSSACTH
eukprot:EG_transcript_17572